MKSEIEISSDFDYKDDPRDSRHLLGMLLTFSLVGIGIVLAIILILINSETVDAFFRTDFGAIVVFGTVLIFGVSWLIWRIRRMVV